MEELRRFVTSGYVQASFSVWYLIGPHLFSIIIKGQIVTEGEKRSFNETERVEF